MVPLALPPVGLPVGSTVARLDCAAVARFWKWLKKALARLRMPASLLMRPFWAFWRWCNVECHKPQQPEDEMMNRLPIDQPLSAEVIDWVHETANEMLREAQSWRENPRMIAK